MHDLVPIGLGHRTLTEEQLKMAAVLPKLKVLPRQLGVALHDGKGGLFKIVGRAERPQKRPVCCKLPLSGEHFAGKL